MQVRSQLSVLQRPIECGSINNSEEPKIFYVLQRATSLPCQPSRSRFCTSFVAYSPAEPSNEQYTALACACHHFSPAADSSLLQCTPIHLFWQPLVTNPINQVGHNLAQETPNFELDLAVVVLPIPITMRLQIRRHQKVWVDNLVFSRRPVSGSIKY